MAGLARERLVLVKASLDDGRSVCGTGYLVSADLVLTASHVVPEQGLAQLELRTERPGK
jgi:hypothetical protein